MASFSINEKVLCYHGPLLYEAKVLKNETWDDTNSKLDHSRGPHYFVHYKGWKNTWDEWVPQSRLLKFTEHNLVLQKQLVQSHKKADSPQSTKPAASGASGGRDSIGGGRHSTTTDRRKDTRGVKRPREDDDRKPELKLVIPDILKVQLVDDWEAVTKNNQLVSLPREPNVRELLEDFQETLKPRVSPVAQLFPELLAGLTLYFNRSLGQNLLYRFERAQYAEAKKKYEVGKEHGLAELYGAEHLLRMIVNMPAMIKETGMDQESLRLLSDHINELLKYLTDRRERVFLSEYDNASLPYLNIYRT
ncbi:MRG-domain-containing protein [Dacryopinax primogenitus]|uniref:Chromatin modification-related protein EAF3 n=1 Tax=Dacryopinax primogenitus (strain DJM 731) TaxID=1858805 RepID=M5FP61_DACPD|nr:MRG-domain-containing protein [Dacryopinax primogenitus]EJT98250.1 MRG-domain-containing protein [Dacryopinax primogenitus]